ncbi:hypothetical protein HQQ81_11745 [Microbacteriaceae bacterium VKM Ac-2854]|nr:hypothetical protein [Microbacteriaceae bacterium VKM Ac-2854]
MKEHVRRIFGFALMPAMSILATLVLLPLISAKFGSGGWSSLAIGQSVGALLAVLVMMAWNVVGGNQIATTPDPDVRLSTYRISVLSRSVVFLIVVPFGIVFALLVLRPEFALATALFLTASAANGLSASWYYSGVGEPRYLVINEGFVRLGGYTVSLVGVLLGLPLEWYGACMVLTGITMFTLNWARVMGRRPFVVPGAWREALSELRRQLYGMSSRITQSIYTYGSVSFVGIFAPGVLPIFAAADQVQKAAYNAIAFLPSAFVAWVGGSTGDARRRRTKASLIFVIGVAVVFLVCWILLSPFIIQILFAGEADISELNLLLIGLAIACSLLQGAFGLLVLVPAGKQNYIYTSVNVCSLIGIAASILGAAFFGVTGALLAALLMPLTLSILYAVRGATLGRTREA